MYSIAYALPALPPPSQDRNSGTEGENGSQQDAGPFIKLATTTDEAHKLITAELQSVFSNFSARTTSDTSGRRKRKAARGIESDEDIDVEDLSSKVEGSSQLAGLSAPALGVEIVQSVNRISINLKKSSNIQGKLKGEMKRNLEFINP